MDSSQIEKSVTHLLVATKQLLETLTQWSRLQASENEVSDVYVRLGYEFNLACRAFNAIGVDTSDLGPVPDLLRTILEDTLSQDASPQSLDQYLPRIRDIIINLLHGLKKKQARLRARGQKEDGKRSGSRQGSMGSMTSGQATVNQMYEEAASSLASPTRPSRRSGSNGSVEEQKPLVPDQKTLPRASSAHAPGDSRSRARPERDASRRETQNILSQSSPDLDATPKASAASSSPPPPYPTPPPPPPKQNNALGALQKGGELERRASRRFSVYQIQKHLGTPPTGVAVPAAQNSPVPNRGRDARESLSTTKKPPPEKESPAKELTIFLQYKNKTKKYVLPEGTADLTIGRLQLAFIEKFAWNTHNNGVDLPQIYIQDPVSGVRYELEDLSDIKDRSVLVLDVDMMDEMKKHFDDGFGGVRRMIESVKGTLDERDGVIQRVSDRQLEAAKEMARLAAAPSVSVPPTSKANDSVTNLISGSDSKLAEIQSLRRDIAVLRQTYSNFSSEIASSMNAIRSKADSAKSAAKDVSAPSYEGDAGRVRVNSGKMELGDESERLVGRVDDLQDLVEDLRKDVVTRGVRPLPRQLEGVSKDISTVTKEIKKMLDFLKREKPIWTKVWEKELQLVCEERDQLTMQEELAADLEDDLEKAAQTFALVEQATKQQTMQNEGGGGGGVLRNTSRNLTIDPAVDPVKAKDDVLGEVRALQPNHESRLEAIERAEKVRRKELEDRRVGKFQRELGNFVQEGKLKKSGGVEEAERLRRAKDDRIRKEFWAGKTGGSEASTTPETEDTNA